MDKKNHLWAPWRSDYVTRPDKPCECVFCEAPREKTDKKTKILYRGKQSFAILNIYPYNCGHAMVAPYRHTGDFESLTGQELDEMNRIVRKLLKKMKKALSPHGFNLGINLGRAAGAGIEEHVHMHIVPRWSGDTNFMPVIAGDKVMPQSLESLWTKLRIKY